MGPLQYQQPTKLILLKITIFSLISSETGEVGLTHTTMWKGKQAFIWKGTIGAWGYPYLTGLSV
jgi:hypothetical protein